jgi:hypothetical protein
MNFFQWQQQSVYEFEQRQMDLQVNYSVDAATQQMLSDGTHIETDYIDWGVMTVEPEIALNTYEAVLLRNLGWGDTTKNREDLEESSIPFFIVATYNGYYVYSRQRDIVVTDGVENTVYDFRWTPKIPYSYTDADNNKCYLYNLTDEYYSWFNLDNPQGTLQESVPLNSGSSGCASKTFAKAVVADVLTKACNSALFIGTEGNTDTEIYIPASMSEWTESNSVDRPTVLTYLSRTDQYTKYDTVTFGVGGAKIDDTNFVICYKVNGSSLYGWAKDREDIIALHKSLGESVVLERVLTSPENAAISEYYYDMSFYGRR